MSTQTELEECHARYIELFALANRRAARIKELEQIRRELTAEIANLRSSQKG